MSESMLRFLIIWGPTFLFIVIVLCGFLWGLVRGFRKSFILFIHMLVAFIACLTVFLCLVKSQNFDLHLVNTINHILGQFGNSLQGFLGVDEGYHTLHEMLLAKIVMDMDEQSLMYYLVSDNAAYIYTLVEMAYRIVLFILVGILYLLLIFIFYLIYLIAYPVRRKVKKHNKKFALGEVSHPYKKKHLLGGLIGAVRSLIVGVVAFSFLGGLLFIVTGGTNLPNRQEARDEEVSFDNEQFNKVYDYYSYVCELSDTGIFKVLNGIKDPSKTPFYFYISDLVFQGQISDANIGVEDKLYLRDETGAYVSFVKEIFLLMVKYSTNEELNTLISNDSSMETKLNTLISLMQQDGFSQEFDQIVDDFETRPFLKSLCISALTSLVNHIDLAAKGNEVLIEVVQTLFTGEDAILVTDLATEQDIKSVFKSLVHVIATSEVDELQAMSDSQDEEEPVQKTNLVKKAILYSRKFLPTIQNLSLLSNPEKKDKGNTIIKKLYQYCSTKFVDESVSLPEIGDDIVWIDEFNILLDIVDPLLGLGYNVYTEDNNLLIDNILDMFSDENGVQNEAYYDSIANQFAKSKLIHVVFQSSFIGKSIDDMLVKMTSNEEASIPKQIEYGSGTDSEGYILLTSLKYMIKNNGKELYHNLVDSKDNVSGEMITAIFDSLKAEITLADQTKTTLVDEMLKSKLFHYVLSSILYYGRFGSFQLYVPQNIVDDKLEGEGETEKVYPVIKKSEIAQICHILVDCKDVIIPLIDNPDDIDYAQIFTNDHLINGINSSILLKGTIANLLINQSNDNSVIVLPADFDHPEKWIEEKEVEAMVDSISALANHKTETGEVLINQLMKGDVKTSDLLGLNSEIIDTLFTSVILRYTVSDLIQNTHTDTFEIVVPYRDYELIDAATISDKKVNVIKKEILGSVLKDIKSVVAFDADGNPKMNMKEIFKNKEVLVTNDVLHATLINYLILLSKNANESSIIVPDHYQLAFEDLRHNPDARENIWYGKDSQAVQNAELYLLLDFIESCIADEQGNIPEEFDMEQDFSSRLTIHNTEENMREITTSALINATISKKIVESMPTPASLYQNQMLEEIELKNLLSNVFLILGKNDIKVSDFENFNTEQIAIKESMVEPMIQSVILCSTFSKYMIDSEYVVVPKVSVYEETLVDQSKHFIVQHTEENNELKTILYTLIDVFGHIEEGDTEKSVKIQGIKTEDMVFTQEMKEKVRDSVVLQASLSYQLIYKGQNNVIIPYEEQILENIEAVSFENAIYMIEINELIELLNVGIHLFGDGNSLKISEMKTEHIMIHKDQVHLITQSVIMNTTIMDGMLSMGDMVIPRVNGKITAVDRLEHPEERCLRIEQDEIEYLLTTLIDVLGTDSQIDTSAIQTSRMFISKDIDITRSEILAATLGSKIIETNEFNIPLDCMNLNVEIVKKSLEITTQDLIQTTALKEFLDGLFSLVDHVTIAYGKSDIDMDDIALTKASMPVVLGSAIFEATISEKLFIEALYIPNLPEVVVAKDYYEKPNQLFIESGEMVRMWDAVFAIFNTDTLSMNQIKDASQIKMIHKSAETMEAILNSFIIKTTVSKAIYDASALEKLPRSIADRSVMNGSMIAQDIPMVLYSEIDLFVPSIFELTPGEVLDLNHLSINQIVLPKQIEEANRFAESDIITATISKQVLAIDSSKIILPDSCLEEDNNASYVAKPELAKLMIGLSVGLAVDGLDSVSDFDAIKVPKVEEQDKITALIESDILRATISKRVLSNDTVAVQQGSDAYSVMEYQGRSVAVLNRQEINSLIAGLNLLGGDLENIQLSITVILAAPNKAELLQIIGASNIYSALMSKELTREVLSTELYLTLFNTNASETIIIDGVASTYSYQSYMGRYVIQNPEENVVFYYDFELSNEVYQSMFTRRDIVALEYVTLTNLQDEILL